MAARSFCDQLVEAGLVAGTDKISIHHYESSYARCLERFLSEAEFAMVEIGYGSGAGIQFWKSVFPNAFIYCFDRDHEDEGDRFKVLKVDQSDLLGTPAQLSTVVSVVGALRHAEIRRRRADWLLGSPGPPGGPCAQPRQPAGCGP